MIDWKTFTEAEWAAFTEAEWAGFLADPDPAEINVTGNSVNIVDGDATPGTGDHTDFGSAIVGGAGVAKIYTVENTGGETLTISSVTVPTGYAIDAGSQVPGAGTTIAASSSKTLTVNLLTASAGVKAGDVTINSDDASEAAYNFAITGTVINTPAATDSDRNNQQFLCTR